MIEWSARGSSMVDLGREAFADLPAHLASCGVSIAWPRSVQDFQG